jgi:hypothetical protein
MISWELLQIAAAQGFGGFIRNLMTLWQSLTILVQELFTASDEELRHDPEVTTLI